MVKKPTSKKAISAKRGGCLTLPQAQLIEQAYKDAVGANPRLSRVGYSKLKLPSTIKRARSSTP